VHCTGLRGSAKAGRSSADSANLARSSGPRTDCHCAVLRRARLPTDRILAVRHSCTVCSVESSLRTICSSKHNARWPVFQVAQFPTWTRTIRLKWSLECDFDHPSRCCPPLSNGVRCFQMVLNGLQWSALQPLQCDRRKPCPKRRASRSALGGSPPID